VDPIRPDPDTERAQKGGKCLVLRPEVVHNGEFRAASTVLEC
jgi:tRNA (guanine37-N1)-methyltransferase